MFPITPALTGSQITEHKYFFRNLETGDIQWNHPDPDFHIEQYKSIPESDGVVPKYETVSYVVSIILLLQIPPEQRD